MTTTLYEKLQSNKVVTLYIRKDLKALLMALLT